MRILYLFVFLSLFLVTCKKETKEIIAEQPTTSVDAGNPCYGDTWTAMGNYNPGTMVPLFVYNNKAYVIRRVNGTTIKRVEIFDGTNWQTLASDIPLWSNHPNVFAFTIGSKGYIGRSSYAGSFYEYDIPTNTWTQKANLPVERSNVSTFAVGNKGYMIGGSYSQNGTTYYSSDTWEYDPANDSWQQKADFSWLAYKGATGFSIGNKGYLVNGEMPATYPIVYLNTLLEFDPVADTWSTKAPVPGDPRIHTAVFVIGGYAYAGGGVEKNGLPTYFNSFRRYNPVTNTWTDIETFPFLGDVEYEGIEYDSYSNIAFTLNSKGYVAYNVTKLAKYTPKTCPPITSGAATATNPPTDHVHSQVQ
jgi:hypothetical protein